MKKYTHKPKFTIAEMWLIQKKSKRRVVRDLTIYWR